MQPTIKEVVQWILAREWNEGDLADYVLVEHVLGFDQLVELFSALRDQSYQSGYGTGYEDGRADGYEIGLEHGREGV
jgi:hypothetical protein